MNLSKKIVVLLCVVGILFFGCHQTPSTIIIDNKPIDIKPMETEESVDMNNLPIVNISEETMDEVIELENMTVILKGVRSVPDSLEGLYMYEAMVNDHYEFEENMLFLFGEHLDLVEEIDERGNYRAICLDCDYSGSVVNSIRQVDGSPDFIYYSRGLSPVTEDMRKVIMTYEEAIYKSEEIINKIGVKNHTFGRIFYWEERLQITPEGTLASPTGDELLVYYYEKLQGVPVLSATQRKSDPKVRIDFDSKGIRCVMITDYAYELYVKIKECIAYDEALELFKKHISRNKDFNGVVFDKVKFEYTIIQEYVNGDFIDIAVPCWHFYCERDYGGSTGFLTSKDIIVNCYDGTVIEDIQYN